MTNYSIIIPHKNSVELLQRCLASIPSRSDIQVIVVDDNSTLTEQERLHFPGTDRDNVTCIFSQDGGGAGHARNVALPLVQGEWIIFADADDYFEPQAFEVFDRHKESTSDIIYYNVTSRFSDTGLPSNRETSIRPLLEQYNALDAPSGYRLRLKFHEPWAKMIRSSMVKTHAIVFDEVRWANDVLFTTKIGYYAQTIEVDLNIVYCVTVAKGSLVHQRSLESRRCRYEVMLRANQFLREVGLAEYQHSLMYSLRRAAKFGPKALIDFIQLGRQYDADFTIGWQDWLKNAWYSLIHDEDKGKKKYIVTDTAQESK